MKDIAKILLIFVLFQIVVFGVNAQSVRPNIIFIMTDDQSAIGPTKEDNEFDSQMAMEWTYTHPALLHQEQSPWLSCCLAKRTLLRGKSAL